MPQKRDDKITIKIIIWQTKRTIIIKYLTKCYSFPRNCVQSDFTLP